MSTLVAGFLIRFIVILVKILYWCILIQVLMSWFAAGRSHLGEMLDQVVEPILRSFRWARIGMLDLSPIVALFALHFVEQLSVQFLAQFL